MAKEEFSFPTITDSSYPCIIDSPPLWHLSPAASPDVFSAKSVGKGDKEGKQRKRCEDEGEKMDLLWENFNEELSRSCSSRFDDSADMVELGCVEALKMSRSNGGMFSQKKPSVVEFLRAFRKLFLLHNPPHHRLTKHHTLRR